MLHQNNNSTEWTRVYTDGSAEEAIRNGGSGFLVCHRDGTSRKSQSLQGNNVPITEQR